jgi:hypothetical protein
LPPGLSSLCPPNWLTGLLFFSLLVMPCL